MVVIGRGSTHVLVRDYHVFVYIWKQYTCMQLVVDYLWANQLYCVAYSIRRALH